MDVEIRLIEAKEYVVAFKLYESFLKEAGFCGVIEAQAYDTFVLDLQKEKCFVAVVGQQFVGFVSYDVGISFIHHLYLAKEYRDRGLGQQLLRFALQGLGDRIYLKCAKQNTSAVQFYLRQGWVILNEGQTEEIDFYLMEYVQRRIQEKQMTSFTIHERLIKDTLPMGRLANSHLLLMRETNIPWFILVPETNKREMHDLNPQFQVKLWEDVSKISRFVKNILKVDKINIGAIGNMVPQLHIHVIGRTSDDYCWPQTVWGRQSDKVYTIEELNRIKGLLISALGENLQ